MADMTMRQLLKAGVHFGHQKRYWSPQMAPYIFGDRNKIHIINLEKTLPMLRDAMNYIGSVVAQGGKVLFVGTKRQAGKIVREQAQRCNSPYVDHRWLGGMLTNFKTVKNSIARLKDLEQKFESGAAARLSKKEALQLDRERTKLDKTLSGIKDMGGLPDVLFVIDVEQEYIAVAEAKKLGIPVVAVVDTNCVPEGVEYIIPGNDDSAQAIQLYMEMAADSILESRTATKSVVVPKTDDEYIELDDSGEVIAPVQVESDVKPVEEVAEAVAQVESAPETAEASPEEPDAKETIEPTEVKVSEAKSVEEKPAEAVAKKKVAKKKVVRKKAAAE